MKSTGKKQKRLGLATPSGSSYFSENAGFSGKNKSQFFGRSHGISGGVSQ
jgi:hypothetical protein